MEYPFLPTFTLLNLSLVTTHAALPPVPVVGRPCFLLLQCQKPSLEDRSKWFKDILWEEKMKTAYEQGRLMLLQNLDPSLSSSEVQVISIPNLWILMDYMES
ncbi:hypothetical protein GLYMA_04G079550v4 [Glycine max]|nr:hypothetical protein GLYMA_04G079550v4 [Glycine max]KAH1110351.1 hypothetical protein GYH30_009287 [Glycine max]